MARKPGSCLLVAAAVVVVAGASAAMAAPPRQLRLHQTVAAATKATETAVRASTKTAVRVRSDGKRNGGGHKATGFVSRRSNSASKDSGVRSGGVKLKLYRWFHGGWRASSSPRKVRLTARG